MKSVDYSLIRNSRPRSGARHFTTVFSVPRKRRASHGDLTAAVARFEEVVLDLAKSFLGALASACLPEGVIAWRQPGRVTVAAVCFEVH